MKITINGKIIENFIETVNGVFIQKQYYEENKTIEGIYAYAHYCPSNKSNKWKVEFRKHYARGLNRKPYIDSFETRMEAEIKVKEIDKILL